MPAGRSAAGTEARGRALVGLTRRPEAMVDDPAALLARVPAGELVELACYHRVPGVVYRSLVALDAGDDLAALRGAYQMAALAHGRCLVELQSAVQALEGLGRPWLVVKGPVLAEIGYGDPGARLYEDLDLVVDPTDLAPAIEGIEAAGGRVADLNWPLMVKFRRAEIPMYLGNGMLGDLHWDLLVTPNIRARFTFPLAELLERRRTVRLGVTDVDTLDAVDGLLYLCLHGSLSGGHQLVWLKDLDQMVAAEPPDWDVLVRRARRHRLDLVAAVQLERARTVLGAAVPEEVVTALAGHEPWWRMWRHREARVGMARWGGYRGTGRTFVAATSGGSLPSVAQLGRSLALDVVRPWVTRRRVSGNADGGEALYEPVGGRERQDEYLGLVSSGAWR
jgi:hypothetical protein